MSNDTTRLLIGDIQKGLLRRLKELDKPRHGNLIKAFVGWILDDRDGQYVDLRLVARKSWEKQGAARTYHDVAALGFCSSMLPEHDELTASLIDGLAWMEERQPFASSHIPDFEVDGLALLGISQGIVETRTWDKNEKLQQWMLRVLEESLRKGRFTPLEYSYLYAAKQFIESVSVQNPKRDVLEIIPDLAIALTAKGLLSIDEETEIDALTIITNSDHSEFELDHVALQLAGLNWLLRQAPTVLPNRATSEDVVRLLQGVSHSFKRWSWETKPRSRKPNAEPIKWEIASEYHVQDLLWVILAPIFPDLEDEEGLPSLGQKHPRADLGIPSLHLIIEVKFIYGGQPSEFAAIIEGVAADTALYLSEKSGYSQVVAFVWDNSRRTEQHSELLQGLRKIRDVMDAVVIPRPGKMELV